MTTSSMSTRQQQLTKRLLEWSDKHSTQYPWRLTRDAFKVLIAEMLLRRTTRKQVNRLFEEIAAKYSNPNALAAASVRSLILDLKPLGIQHARARIMKRLAAELLREHGGRIPQDKDDLLDLPGVGEYTANAVLCFAFGQNLPLIDTNSERVLIRVFSFKSSKKEVRKDSALWELARQLIPPQGARKFNIALLDFADSVCTKRNPRCPTCPMTDICDYGARERHEVLQGTLH